MSSSNNNSSPNAVSLKGATVTYRSYKERPTSLKESVLRFFKTGKIRHHSTFQALSNINLDFPKGSVTGIIGSNGSGKSTMLKIISKVLPPSAGSVEVHGSMASLIELGAGFDPELDAIENLYLNGSLFKRSRKEMKERIPNILEFAELQEFANTPIKYYSSGMFARLGFSAAIDVNPDILVVDEILAVGDERFQQKCQGVFDDFLRRGKTLIMVSHSIDMLEKLCHSIAVLSKGELIYHGDPHLAVALYRDPAYKVALSV